MSVEYVQNPGVLAQIILQSIQGNSQVERRPPIVLGEIDEQSGILDFKGIIKSFDFPFDNSGFI